MCECVSTCVCLWCVNVCVLSSVYVFTAGVRGVGVGRGDELNTEYFFISNFPGMMYV